MNLLNYCKDHCWSFSIKMISRFSAIPIRIQGGIVWGNWQANSEIYHENKNGQKKIQDSPEEQEEMIYPIRF